MIHLVRRLRELRKSKANAMQMLPALVVMWLADTIILSHISNKCKPQMLCARYFVAQNRGKGGERGLTPQEFKLAVKHRLIDKEMTQADMIRAVREKTGMFLDTSYLNKIYKGQKRSKKIIEAIREVLDLPTE